MAKRVLGKSRFDRAYAFAVIREPVEWLFSCYQFFMLGRSEIIGRELVKIDSFESYIQEMANLGDFKPSQGCMLVDGSCRLLVDQIGFFDGLRDLSLSIVSRLSLPGFEISHLNKNPLRAGHCALRPKLDKESTKLVRFHWSLDFAIWELAQNRLQGLKGLQLDPALAPLVCLETYDPWGKFKWTIA
jgi:hypothetical protein